MHEWRKGLALVGALIVIAAVAGYVIAGRGDTEYEATAKIAFIEDTRFDYVDAERDRLIGFVNSDAGTALLDRPGVLGIAYDRPDTVTFFDVTVTATTPELAADTANAVAALIVEGDLAVRRAPLEAELAVLEQQIDELDVEIDLLDTQIIADMEREAFAEANRFEGEAADLERLTIELRQAQDQLFLNERLRNSLVDYRTQAETGVADLQVDLAGAAAETRVVTPAAVPSDRSDVSAGRGAALAALAALGFGGIVLGLLAAPSREPDPT